MGDIIAGSFGKVEICGKLGGKVVGGRLGVVERPDKGVVQAVMVVEGEVKTDGDERFCLRAGLSGSGRRRALAFMGRRERVCGFHGEGRGAEVRDGRG